MQTVLDTLEVDEADDPLPGDIATPAYTRRLLDGHRVRTVEDGEALEPGLSVLLTPGHSRGSSTLLVETPEGVAGIVGDALPLARCYLQGLPTLIVWSEQEARESIHRIAARCGLVYPGHDRPFRIVEGGTQYLGPLTVTVSTPVEAAEDNLAVTFMSDVPGGRVSVDRVPPPPLQRYGRA